MEAHHAKKVAAAIAAVLQHAAETEPPAPTPSVVTAAPPVSPAAGSWSLSGRQEAMSFRALWQRRLSRSW